jgi:hypothetical protein
MRSVFILVFIFAAIGCAAFDTEDSISTIRAGKIKRFRPHYIALQYAGNIGFASAGVGYASRKDTYQVSLIYGYAPPSIAGVQIHTITAKNIFPLYRFYINRKQTVIPYGAIGVSLEVGGKSFFKQPSNMPRSYYDFPKSLHVIPALGVKLRHMTSHPKHFRGYEFFVETTTVDVYVWYKFTSDEVTMAQILSLAAGVHLLRN